VESLLQQTVPDCIKNLHFPVGDKKHTHTQKKVQNEAPKKKIRLLLPTKRYFATQSWGSVNQKEIPIKTQKQAFSQKAEAGPEPTK